MEYSTVVEIAIFFQLPLYNLKKRNILLINKKILYLNQLY